MSTPPRVLIIAGSDPSGGAGMQADIKTVTMLGGYAMGVLSALTVQNTRGLTHIEPISPDLVIAQIDACLSDIGADAIKIGMLGSPHVALAVSERLEGFGSSGIPIIFDPVIAATNGGDLATAETVAAFERLVKIATLITPNLPEYAALSTMAGGEAKLRDQCHALLITGGHGEGEMIIDQLLWRSGLEQRWENPRLPAHHTHGTGCTLASAIATHLGAGMALPEAVAQAIAFVRAAILAAPGFGTGIGPLGHHAMRDFTRNQDRKNG